MMAALAESRGKSDASAPITGGDVNVDGGVGGVGPATAAAQREANLNLPLPYLPSVGALFLLLAAVASHVLLALGKRWSVPFLAW